MANPGQPLEHSLPDGLRGLTLLQKVGFGVIAASVAGAALFDGRNDTNNVVATVNLAILGLALVRAGSR